MPALATGGCCNVSALSATTLRSMYSAGFQWISTFAMQKCWSASSGKFAEEGRGAGSKRQRERRWRRAIKEPQCKTCTITKRKTNQTETQCMLADWRYVRVKGREGERWREIEWERYVVKWAGFPLGLRLGVCGLAANVVIVILAEFIMNRR